MRLEGRPSRTRPAQVNNFYLSKQEELSTRLQDSAFRLQQPQQWILCHVDAHESSLSLSSLVPMMEAGRHVSPDMLTALMHFVLVCEEIDLLRKYSVLNYLAAAKARRGPPLLTRPRVSCRTARARRL